MDAKNRSHYRKNHKKPTPMQTVAFAGSNVQLTFTFNRDEYEMLKYVAAKRKRSIRSLVLRMFYDLNYQ